MNSIDIIIIIAIIPGYINRKRKKTKRNRTDLQAHFQRGCG
jgi:hypothetical protein